MRLGVHIVLAVALMGSAAAGAGVKTHPGIRARDASAAEAKPLPLQIYKDVDTEGEVHYVPSGWIGHLEAMEFDDAWTNRPAYGNSCIRIRYSSPTDWAGIVWQNPPNDWGAIPGGIDLRGARRLVFWARGNRGGEVVEFKMGVLDRGALYPDSATASRGSTTLSRHWKRYVIPLGGKDLGCIKTGFVVAFEGRGRAVEFFLDEIHYE